MCSKLSTMHVLQVARSWLTGCGVVDPSVRPICPHTILKAESDRLLRQRWEGIPCLHREIMCAEVEAWSFANVPTPTGEHLPRRDRPEWSLANVPTPTGECVPRRVRVRERKAGKRVNGALGPGGCEMESSTFSAEESPSGLRTTYRPGCERGRVATHAVSVNAMPSTRGRSELMLISSVVR